MPDSAHGHCWSIEAVSILLSKTMEIVYYFDMDKTIGSNVKKGKLKLSQYLFWDIDVNKLDYESRASFVLERVFTMGMQEDEWKVNHYYGKERIRKEVVKCKSLDKKTLTYLSIFYGIPKKEFECYMKDAFPKAF